MSSSNEKNNEEEEEAPPSMFKKLAEAGKEMADTKTGRTVMAMFGLATAITSIVTAIIAFVSFQAGESSLFSLTHFKKYSSSSCSVCEAFNFFKKKKLQQQTPTHAATDNLDNLIGNWERAPISGMYLSATTTCPTGYDLMDTPSWPGTTTSACACPANSYVYDTDNAVNIVLDSTSTACTVNQTSTSKKS
jgi:hypothetical protein